MINVFRKFAKPIVKQMSRPTFQPLFWRIYQLAIMGMNVGHGAGVQTSGELGIIHSLNRDFHDDVVIFDLGANVGMYSLAVQKILGKRARIFAFEPSRTAFEQASKRLLPYTNIQIFDLGMGNKIEDRILYATTAGSATSSIYQRRLDHYNRQYSVAENIRLTTLDAFCMEHNIDHIHLLKLDTEGNELDIIKGAQQMIHAEAIDYIQFEFGGCNIDSRTFLQDYFYLLKNDFRIYRVLTHGLYEIETYSELNEMFLTTNYLAQARRLNRK